KLIVVGLIELDAIKVSRGEAFHHDPVHAPAGMRNDDRKGLVTGPPALEAQERRLGEDEIVDRPPEDHREQILVSEAAEEEHPHPYPSLHIHPTRPAGDTRRDGNNGP